MVEQEVCWVHGDGDDGISHRCPNGHGICAACLENSATDGIPTTCQHPGCGALLDHVHFLKCLPPAKRRKCEEQLLDTIQRVAAKPGEQTKRCAKCDLYMVVVDNACADNAMQCANPRCAHYEPASELKGAVGMLLEAMVPVKCPKCKKPTVLESGCMKITCSTPDCGAKYCYLCEKNLGVGVEDAVAYGHFEGVSSCPLMIEHFHEIDASWPSDYAAALDKFHQWAIRRNLDAFRQGHPEKFKLAIESPAGVNALRDLNMTSEDAEHFVLESLPRAFTYEGFKENCDDPGRLDIYLKNHPPEPNMSKSLVFLYMRTINKVAAIRKDYREPSPDCSIDVLEVCIRHGGLLHGDKEPLIIAIVNRLHHVVEYILEKSPDVLEYDFLEHTLGLGALMVAARMADLYTFELLIEHGVRVTPDDFEVFQHVLNCYYERQEDPLRQGDLSVDNHNRFDDLRDIIRSRKDICRCILRKIQSLIDSGEITFEHAIVGFQSFSTSFSLTKQTAADRRPADFIYFISDVEDHLLRKPVPMEGGYGARAPPIP